MVSCLNCGAELYEGGIFCEHCGNEIKTSEITPTLPPNTPILPAQSPPLPPFVNEAKGTPTKKPHSKLLIPGSILTALGSIWVFQSILLMTQTMIWYVQPGRLIFLGGSILLGIGLPLLIVGIFKNRDLRKIYRIPRKKIAIHMKYIIAGIVATCIGYLPVSNFLTVYEQGSYVWLGPSAQPVELRIEQIMFVIIGVISLCIGGYLLIRGIILYRQIQQHKFLSRNS